MPASAAPNVGLNYGWSVGESGWGAGQSYNLFVSDWFLQPRVLNITNTPPGSPALGDAYVCGTSPTGAWSGKANQIAVYYNSTWYFFPAKSGWSVYNVADGLEYQYSGSAWVSTIKVSTLSVGSNALNVNTAGRVLIGTATDDGTNSLQVNGSAIISNNAKVRGGAGISLLVGSDTTSNTTITDATQKNVRIAVPHYTNAEEPAALFFATINSSANDIHIGGGSSLVNAATSIKMETAANNTTTSGTVRFHVNSAGRTLIGPTLPTDDGVNAVQINGAVTIATGNTYKVNNVSVVGARDTGWAAMTGTTNKATAYDTSTVTLPQLAGRVMALQAALTTHGLLGT